MTTNLSTDSPPPRGRWRLLAVAFVVAVVLPVAAHAASIVVYDNSSPADLGQTGIAVNAPSLPTVDEMALRFRAQQGGMLESFRLAVSAAAPENYSGTDDGWATFSVKLYTSVTDEEGSLPFPGELLASVTTAIPGYSQPQFLTLFPTQSVQIVAGSFYFLALEVLEPELFVGWHLNANGTRGIRSIYGLPAYPGSWYTQTNTVMSSMRITALPPVPVPAAAGLLVSALGALAVLRRRAGGQRAPA